MEMKRYNTDPLPLGKKGEEKLEVLINIEKHETHENEEIKNFVFFVLLINIEKHEKHENEEIKNFVFFVLFDVQIIIWPTQNVLQQ